MNTMSARLKYLGLQCINLIPVLPPLFLPYLSGLLLEKANNLSIFLDLGGHDTQCLQQEEIEGKHHSPLHVLVLEASHLIEEEKVK